MDRYSSDYLQVSTTILLQYIDHVCSCILDYTDQLQDIKNAEEWKHLSINDYQFFIKSLDGTINDVIMFTQLMKEFEQKFMNFYDKKYLRPFIYSETFENDIFTKEKKYLTKILLSGK